MDKTSVDYLFNSQIGHVHRTFKTEEKAIEVISETSTNQDLVHHQKNKYFNVPTITIKDNYGIMGDYRSHFIPDQIDQD